MSTSDADHDSSTRTWWPAAIAAGLIAAAIVGVLVLTTGDDADESITSAPSTAGASTTMVEPTTTSAPTTTPFEAEVTLAERCVEIRTGPDLIGAQGCFDPDDTVGLGDRMLVTQVDQLYEVTFDSAASPSIAPIEALSCRGDEITGLLAEGDVVEIVICNDDAGLVARLGSDPNQRATWLTLAGPQIPTGSDLGVATRVDGLPDALTFAAPLPDSAICSIVLPADRSTWKEICVGDALRPLTAITLVDADVVELSIDDAGLATTATPLDRFSHANGCTVADARALLSLMPTTSIVDGLACLDDTASASTGPVLLQAGPPDGSLWSAQRDTEWVITDQGTGLTGSFAFPVPQQSTWSAWRGDTNGRPSSFWGDAIAPIGVQPDVATLADEILTAVRPLQFDPEFPLDERLVAVEPDGLPLIVAQVDIGGDDSVAGAVLFVWIEEAFDDDVPIGWQPTRVLVSNICARGAPVPEGELCP